MTRQNGQSPTRLRPAWFALLALAAAALAGAADTPPPPPAAAPAPATAGMKDLKQAADKLSIGGKNSPIDIQADQYEFRPDTGEAYGRGNIRLLFEEVVLTADELSANLYTKVVSAKGHVKLQRGVFTWEGDAITGNLETREFRVGEYRAFADPWFFRGASGAYNRKGEVEIGQARMSSCSHLNEVGGKPHYAISAKRIVYYPDGRYKAYGMVVRLFEIPLTPPITYSGSTQGNSGFTIRPGYSSAWGGFLLVTKTFDVAPGLSVDGILEGRTKRGVAAGTKVTHRKGDSSTEVLVYGMEDSDPPTTSEGQTRRFDETRERYRVEAYHRTDLPDDLTLRLRADALSDIDMLEDWFENEYRSNPQPKSFGDLTWDQNRFALSGYVRPRINTFESAVETLPAVRLQMPRQRLADSPFYYQSETTVANLHMSWRDYDYDRPDGEDGKPLASPDDYEATRIDTTHMFYAPFKLQDTVQIVPRAGVRATYYSQSSKKAVTTSELNNNLTADDPDNYKSTVPVTNYDDEGGEVTRITGEAGLEASTKFYRTWQKTKNDYLEINGLRHVVQPYANYTYVADPSENRDNLYFFDEVDRLTEQNFVRTGVRQRWETRRSQRIYTLASLENYADFPFTKEDGAEELDGPGYFGTRATFSPREYLKFHGHLLADMGENKVDGGRIGATYGDPKTVLWDVSYLYRDQYTPRTVYSMGSDLTSVGGDTIFPHAFDDGHFITLGSSFPINAKTAGRVEYRYDILGNRLASQTYEISRDLHCWIGALRLEQNADDSFNVMLIFYLKADPQIGIDTSF
ncbi:MAG: putative LPS assembly protein LptD [Lentisphaeria bacterium]